MVGPCTEGHRATERAWSAKPEHPDRKARPDRVTGFLGRREGKVHVTLFERGTRVVSMAARSRSGHQMSDIAMLAPPRARGSAPPPSGPNRPPDPGPGRLPRALLDGIARARAKARAHAWDCRRDRGRDGLPWPVVEGKALDGWVRHRHGADPDHGPLRHKQGRRSHLEERVRFPPIGLVPEYRECCHALRPGNEGSNTHRPKEVLGQTP